MLSYYLNLGEWEGRKVRGWCNWLLWDKLTESIKGRKAPFGNAKGFLREATFGKTIHGVVLWCRVPKANSLNIGMQGVGRGFKVKAARDHDDQKCEEATSTFSLARARSTDHLLRSCKVFPAKLPILIPPPINTWLVRCSSRLNYSPDLFEIFISIMNCVPPPRVLIEDYDFR